MNVSLTRENYTVGWVCALPKELTAAMAMLDGLHPPLPQPPYDDNSYTLGSVGDHNVVIACLPNGQTGSSSAAIVVDQMRRSFRSVRFGLMVGIGGAVPSASHDIRLGDVVVSKPGTHNGGVVQYDFGKTEKGGRFIHTGSLRSPPKVLLSALSKMQAMQSFQGNQLTQYLSEIKPSMQQRGFQYQGAESDQLFEAEYDHVGDNPTCEKCEVDKLVKRLDRDNSDPVIHYGTIASGNQVMKHGKTRDRLGREFAVLCFEMEAAGLMDNFPCVVIRGISDYADSHKNKRWQEYAAATAAAYAKALLSIIPAMEITAAPAVSGQLGTWLAAHLTELSISLRFIGSLHR
jgi:nucleoside phosphorylase